MATAYVRLQQYTNQFIEREELYTLSFFPQISELNGHKSHSCISYVLVFCANTDLPGQAEKIINGIKAGKVPGETLNSMKWLSALKSNLRLSYFYFLL